MKVHDEGHKDATKNTLFISFKDNPHFNYAKSSLHQDWLPRYTKKEYIAPG